MKITVNTHKLCETLAIGARSAMSKATMPVLGCALLEARKAEQRLYISSTNLDISVRASMPAEIDEDYSVALNAGMLVRIAAEMPGEQISLAKVGAVTVIKSGNSCFRLHGIPADEFPAIKDLQEGTALEFTQAELLAKLSAVSCCASTDTSRYILNGVYVSNRNSKRTFVATDGRRLHLIEEAGQADGVASAILPNLGIQKLMTMLKHGDKVRVWLGDRSATFRIDREDGEILFVSKVVEGNYPNYRQVIPSRTEFLTISRAEFIAALSRVSMVTSAKSASAKMKIEGTELTLSASSPDLGEAKETLTIPNPKEFKGDVAFSPILMIAAIESAGGETVEISLDPKSSEAGPILIRSGSFTAVVMPVRLT